MIKKVEELEASKKTQHEEAAAPEQASTSAKEHDEPQNELTKAFTEQDWAGVKHLRVSTLSPKPEGCLIARSLNSPKLPPRHMVTRIRA